MNYIKQLSLKEEDQDLNIGYIRLNQTPNPLVQLRMLLVMEMDLRSYIAVEQQYPHQPQPVPAPLHQPQLLPEHPRVRPHLLIRLLIL